jgi:hypothetical protein
MHTPVGPGTSERVEDLIALHWAEQSTQVFVDYQTVLQRPVAALTLALSGVEGWRGSEPFGFELSS